MLDLLPSISEWINVDGKKCTLIWKGQLAVLLLYKEQKINFSGLADMFTDVVIYLLLLYFYLNFFQFTMTTFNNFHPF